MICAHNSRMIYDLHSHTTCSDGTLRPVDLAARAIENGVNALAITDHDTIAAYDQLTVPENLTLIPGIEFSTQWHGIGVHIVGLNLKLASDAIKTGVDFQLTARRTRAEKIAERLEKAGLANALAGAKQHAGEAEISRPHFASYMVETGFSKNVEHAFKKYLGSGKPGDIKQLWAEPAQVITWIRDSGGVAVLAHPHKYRMTRTKLLALVDDFIAAGGQGIEVLSGSQGKDITEMLRDISLQKNLLASVGSDYHGASTPWCKPGMHTRLPSACTPVWSVF